MDQEILLKPGISMVPLVFRDLVFWAFWWRFGGREMAAK